MGNLYKTAGVDIDAGQHAVELMKEAVRDTYTASVLADVGSFGALYALDDLPDRPVLVASTDGVGTKVKLAATLGRWEGIGADIVNHCVNDILVQGARPLFFLDYIASSRLVPEQVAAVVTGAARACRAAGCALIGGETAEMPGVYAEGAFDVVGSVVGIVGRETLLPRQEEMADGDLLVGLPSSGPHTNGYSLIRRVVEPMDLAAPAGEDGRSLGEALLAPHRCYLQDLARLAGAGVRVKGLAHITGGGIIDNLPRIVPPGLVARVDSGSWPVPSLFRMLVEQAGMAEEEAFRVFNMGIGMVAVVAPEEAGRLGKILPDTSIIGRLAAAPSSEQASEVHLVGSR